MREYTIQWLNALRLNGFNAIELDKQVYRCPS